MRITKTVGTGFLALSVCLNFFACSNNDDNIFDDSNGGAMPTKRISEIYYDISTSKEAIKAVSWDYPCRIDYAEDGKVLRFRGYNEGNINNIIGTTWLNDDEWGVDKTFTYIDDGVIAKGHHRGGSGAYTYYHHLNKDGFVDMTKDSNNYFYYENGYLTAWGAINSDNYYYSFKYQEGNLITGYRYSLGKPIDNFYISYGTQKNKGGIVDPARFLSIPDGSTNDWAALMYAGIFGKPNNLLPVKMIHTYGTGNIENATCYEFTYQLDNDGYVKSIYITQTNNSTNEVSTVKLCYKYIE